MVFTSNYPTFRIISDTFCKFSKEVFPDEANWQPHLASTAHQQREKISSKNKSITSFFQKAVETPHPQPGLLTSHLAAFTLSASLPSMSYGLGETSKNNSAFTMVSQKAYRRLVLRR